MPEDSLEHEDIFKKDYAQKKLNITEVMFNAFSFLCNAFGSEGACFHFIRCKLQAEKLYGRTGIDADITDRHLVRLFGIQKGKRPTVSYIYIHIYICICHVVNMGAHPITMRSDRLM